MCSYADLNFHLGLLKIIALLAFFWDWGFDGWFWILLDEAGFQYWLLDQWKCFFFGWGVDCLIWRFLLCLSIMVFLACLSTLPFSCSLTLDCLIWVLLFFPYKNWWHFTSLFIDCSDSLLFTPFSVFICIWIQEWKLNWIFSSRVCQVTFFNMCFLASESINL